MTARVMKMRGVRAPEYLLYLLSWGQAIIPFRYLRPYISITRAYVPEVYGDVFIILKCK